MPRAKRRLTDIKVDEASLVSEPANGKPFHVIKSVVQKANEPSDDMSREELEEAREARSKAYKIEVLETGSNLTYPKGYPTDLDEYGDPVNLKYPIDTKKRAANARTRFKQNADKYQKEKSKEVIHNRIVEAELEFGIEPDYDPDDPLDQLLSSDLKAKLEKLEDEVSKNYKDVVQKMKIAAQLVKSFEEAVKSSRIEKSLSSDEPLPDTWIRSINGIVKQFEAVIDPEKSEVVDITKEITEVSKEASSWAWRDETASISHAIYENVSTYIDDVDMGDEANGLILIKPIEKSAKVAVSLYEDLIQKFTPDKKQVVKNDGSRVEKEVQNNTPEKASDDMRSVMKGLKNVIEQVETVTKGLVQNVESMNVMVAKLNGNGTEPEPKPVVKSDDSESISPEGNESTSESNESSSVSDETIAQVATAVVNLTEMVQKATQSTAETVQKMVDTVSGINERVEKMITARSSARGEGAESTHKVQKEQQADENPLAAILPSYLRDPKPTE